MINFRKKIFEIKIIYFYYYLFRFYLASHRRQKNFYFSNIKFKKYWSYFLKNLSKNKEDKKQINILMDPFDIPNWYISNYLFINYLKKSFKVNIFTFDLKKKSKEKELIDNKIGVTKHFIIRPNIKNIFKIKKIFLHLIKKIKSKKDLVNFRYKGLNFGIDIYESILREGLKTVNLENKITYKGYFLFAMYYVNFEEIFKNKIHYVLLSHDCYIQFNVAAKLARKKKAKLFLINSKEIVKSKKTFIQHEIFKKYRKNFLKLKKTNYFKKLRIKAKENLKKRVNGNLKINMDYQALTAFHNRKIKPQIENKKNYNVLIATHCFFDNPHAFAQLNYLDYWDWIIFLGNISKESPKNFSWYVKPHRDFLPGTMEILKSFVEKFPNIKILDTNVSFKQLATEGLDLILTCHGSIAHEAPMLGINVINCAYNNSIKFNFSKTILNKKTLKKVILNSRKKKHFFSEDIYDFYAIHYLHHGENKFWMKFTNPSTDKNINFLKNFSDYKKIENKIDLKIERFLKSKLYYSKEMF